jgi:hypothetical protein
MAMAQSVVEGSIHFGPAELMQGLEARKVLLAADRKSVGLDARVFKFGKERAGVITTDLIDLGPSAGILGIPAKVKKIACAAEADLPEGATVAVEVRTGETFFDQASWSPWQALPGLKGMIDAPAGRFAQVRLTLGGQSETALPAVRSLSLKADFATASVPADLRVVDARIQKIVRSSIDFKYERPDQPRIAKFRKDAELDKVVAGAKDDFEKLVRLMDWAGSCYNDRSVHKEEEKGIYAWDIDRIFGIVEVEKDGRKVRRPTVYGHCMSYAELLVTAATAMGYKGRHMCMEGFREASHEVTDIWVPSLGKWVYFDPSLSNYYFDKATQVPLNLIEIHGIVVDNFIPAGKDTDWFRVQGSAETRAVVKRVGGQKPIGSRLGPWKYGEPMPQDYDWGFLHGYLAAGVVQMTPRNDFHSAPEANPKRFGHNPGYAGYPNWVDDKTPPTNGAGNWFTRQRDFYWTLDQASLRLTLGTEPGTLMVELGQSMPFFKRYDLKVDGKPVKNVTNPFVWKIQKGRSQLEVAPVDEFGVVGLASSVTVASGSK